MKKAVKFFGAVAAIVMAAALVFAGCSDDDDDDDGGSSYSLSVSESSVEFEGKDAEAQTVAVTTNGTFTVASSDTSVATVAKAQDGKSVTITPVAKGDALVTITCVEDKSKVARIAVTVASAYSIEFTAESKISGNTVKVDAGGSVTLAIDSAKTTGAWTATKDDSVTQFTIAETKSGDTVTGWTIAGAAEDTDGKTFTLHPTEAESDTESDVTVTVKVYGTVDMPITLTGAVATSAKVVKVGYGAEDESKGERDTITIEEKDLSASGVNKTATAKLKKRLANDSLWINNIAIQVYNSDATQDETTLIDAETTVTDNVADVYANSFAISNANFKGYTVAPAVASKTFTINFTGFTIPGGSVEGLKYATKWLGAADKWAETDNASSVKTPAVTVADDGSSATFTVNKADLDAAKPEFYVQYANVKVKKSGGAEIALTSKPADKAGDGGVWYSYSADDSMKAEFAFVDSSAWTELKTNYSFAGDSSGTTQVIATTDADFPTKVPTSLKIVVEDANGWVTVIASDTAGDWGTADTKRESLQNATDGVTIITDAAFLDAFAKNGLCFAGSACKISVYYVAGTQAPVIPVTSIATTPASSLSVVSGGTATFTVTVEPANATDKTFTVTSASEDKATVDKATASSGDTITVTGVAAGSSVITIASTSDPAVKATITATVTAEVVPVIGAGAGGAAEVTAGSSGNTLQLLVDGVAPSAGDYTFALYTDSAAKTPYTAGKVTVGNTGILTAASDAPAAKIYVTATKNGKTSAPFPVDVKVEEKMTLTVTFKGFTIAGGSATLHYGNNDNNQFDDVTGAVAADGASATFTVLKKFAKTDGWYEGCVVTCKDSGSAEIETTYDSWFKFKDEGGTLDVSKKDTSEWTELKADSEARTFGNSLAELVSTAEFSGKTITKLKVAVANCAYSGDGDWWVNLLSSGTDWNANKVTPAWDDDIKGYSTVIDDASAISAYTTNGLFIAGLSGMTGKVTVSYQ